ncbi:FAD/NAD(P)-binding protein [Streptomyces sp. WZ-12]|uniref:FAD/NAD(P)-binding protein n=1 Tax=Streptomyces sp. WZ-12 TaxID=3030210 RepID=UPI0023813D84|nr:FAD/NAD(P)-binding protein [Streptomyces sp. WZ-12]
MKSYQPGSDIAVIGAGAAGSLTATRLLQHADRHRLRLDVWLIDPARENGRGPAYGTEDARHLLNVPAGRMTAFAEDPAHLVHWLADRHPQHADHDAFVPRALYGRYLSHVLDDTARRTAGARLHRVHARAIGTAHHDDSTLSFLLSSGRTLRVDAAVLALGNFAADCRWAPEALRTSHRFVAAPWSPDALSAVPPGADVLLVGTGLTMADLTLSLRRPDRTLIAVSRSGLLPQPHAAEPLPQFPPPVTTGPPGLDAFRRAVLTHLSRSRRAHGDWRPGFDSLRPLTSDLWRQLPPADRTRFLKEHLRLWEVHRHRMPPPTAAAVRQACELGQLRLASARLTDATVTGDGVRVRLSTGTTLDVGAVVNCTGSRSDVGSLDDPFLHSLFKTGLARPHATGLGLSATRDGRLLSARGRGDTMAPLWALGSLLRGELLETTAIPEIRVQADEIAASAVALLTRGEHPQRHQGLFASP